MNEKKKKEKARGGEAENLQIEELVQRPPRQQRQCLGT